jgi:hypothetical protein
MAKALRHNPFPMKERAKAFLKGLPKSEGLLEVAREGLKRDIGGRLRARYLSRVARGGNVGDIQKLVADRQYLPADISEGSDREPYRTNMMPPRMDHGLQKSLSNRMATISVHETGSIGLSGHPTLLGSVIRSPITWSEGIALFLSKAFTGVDIFSFSASEMDVGIEMSRTAINHSAFFFATVFPVLAFFAFQRAKRKREQCARTSASLLSGGEVDSDYAQARLAGVVARHGSFENAVELYSDRKVTSEKALDILGNRILDGL